MAKPHPVHHQKLLNSREEANRFEARLDQLTSRMDQVLGTLNDLTQRVNVLENKNVPQNGNIENVPVSFTFKSMRKQIATNANVSGKLEIACLANCR